MCSCPWASSLGGAGGIANSPCSTLSPFPLNSGPLLLFPVLVASTAVYSIVLARIPGVIMTPGPLSLPLSLWFVLTKDLYTWLSFFKHIANAFVWDLAISCRVCCHMLPIYFPQCCQSDLSKNAILSCQSS